MKFIGCTSTFFIFLITLISNAHSETITLAADHWCPVNCDPNSERPGYMIEVAKRVFEDKNINVNYIILPWARAIAEAKTGNVDAIVGAFHGDAPQFIYPDEELGLIGNSFFTHQHKDWHYHGVDSLEEVVLGVIKGYDYGEPLATYVKNHRKNIIVLTGEENVLSRGLNMIMANRVDVIVESDIVFWYQASEDALKDSMKFAGQASKPTKAYIAFSPTFEHANKYAEMLSQGIINLRSTGELTKILASYGLQDWK